MKNFNYNARDNSGAVKKGSLQAADRNAALQTLKAQGLVPISLAEGTAPSEALRLSIAPRTLALAGAALVLVVGAFLMMQTGTPEVKERKAQVKKAAKASQVKPVEVKKTVRALPVTNQVATAPVQPEPPEVAPVEEPAPVKVADDVTPPPVERPSVRLVETIEGMSTNPPPSDYDSGTERVINMLMSARMGNPPPPLLNFPPGENITNILNRDIILRVGDSEQTATEKKNVAYVKQLMKEYMKEGGTPETFLQYYHGELTKAFEEWRAAQKFTTDLLKAGDEKGAAKFMEEQNKLFSEKGIRPITLPPQQK